VQNRRDILKGAAGLLAGSSLLRGQISDHVAVVNAGGSNVVVFSAGSGVVLVDSGAPKSWDEVSAALKGATVQTLFNTHYHLDQTANNEQIAAMGAKIIAHLRTKEWMSTEYWVEAQERYEKARPKAARPTDVFLTTGSLKAGGEQIDYGHLTLAHTSGDIYVYFRNANAIAVGDVASPVLDPSLDYFTGAWIGGRVDSMDTILKLTDNQTRIVPAVGPVMSRAEFKAERDMMEEIRARLFKLVREGDGPEDLVEAGVLKNLARQWKDPENFMYAAAKGLWAHHDKLDYNVV